MDAALSPVRGRSPRTSARFDRAQRWHADPMAPERIAARLGAEEGHDTTPASSMPEHQGDGA